MKYRILIAGLALVSAATAQANSVVLECATTSGEKSQWLLGDGELRWNYGEGWSDNRCGANDKCYFNEHGVYLGNSAVRPGDGDAWDIMYSPSDGELLYEDEQGGTTTFCHPE